MTESWRGHTAQSQQTRRAAVGSRRKKQHLLCLPGAGPGAPADQGPVAVLGRLGFQGPYSGLGSFKHLEYARYCGWSRYAGTTVKDEAVRQV